MSAFLLERHAWETSGSSHQIQIPKDAFVRFFGRPGTVGIRVGTPGGPYTMRRLLLSYYAKSDTYRFNWLTEFGTLGHAVVVFAESGDISRPYDVWWFTGADAKKVLGLPLKWRQAKPSQYGPGRKWTVI